jgi:hypothetical protein
MIYIYDSVRFISVPAVVSTLGSTILIEKFSNDKEILNEIGINDLKVS